MKRVIRLLRSLAVSRAVTPCVIGVFLVLYVAIAFGTNEPLTMLMGVTRRTVLLVFLLAFIPLNRAARLAFESLAFFKRRKALSGKSEAVPDGLFDEELRLPGGSALPDQERLRSLGYATWGSERSLAAWRGITIFPARFLFLLATFCLFAGILLNLTTRTSRREPVVEGEPMPGGGGMVERIVLKDQRGLLLDRSLEIKVAGEGGEKKTFGLYPPSRHQGFFVYPRYLGVAPLVRFSAPDLPEVFERYLILMIYPPGKEDGVEIPGSPYRIVFKLAEGADGDPYVTGRITLAFRIMQGQQLMYSGTAPIGGEVVMGSSRIAFPDAKRLVATDFVQDQGVVLIWSAGWLFLAALLWWLPVRLWFPRQEMLFLIDRGEVLAFSRAEGRRSAHAGSYHEVLDQLQANPPCPPFAKGGTPGLPPAEWSPTAPAPGGGGPGRGNL